ncbi:MAG: hypothetical protein HPAVJP_1220 [Candidatus Hepatoplasma vulgare]|nr:MAG: hypothetical protein HPAVJP_1220 [Candidatus Hepatoplasma sp.]
MLTYTKTLFKQYLRTPYTYIAFLLPILFIVGLGKIIPAGLVIPSAITIGVTISILFLFGGTVQEMRSTSFIKSISITKLSKSSIVLVNMFVASVISIFAIIVILALSYGLDSAGFFAQDFTAFSPDTEVLKYLNSTIIWNEVEWGTFVYAVILTAILSFAIAYLIISFTKTTNSLYIISFIYVFVMILMGGILVPTILSVLTGSFVQYLNVWVPHYYTNQLMSASMVTDNVVLGNLIKTIDENGGAGAYIVSLLSNLPSLDSWNWDAISHDVNLIDSFIKSGSDTTSYEAFTDFLGYKDPADAFDSELFKILVEPRLVSVPVLGNISILEILCFGADGVGPFIPIVDFNHFLAIISNNSDVIIQYTHSVTTWDFNSYESIANSFMPIIVADVFATIGIYKFNWTIK